MTDERDLLRAIPENPADDIVRLVYADWLEEHAGTVRCGQCEGREGYWDDGGFKYQPALWVDCRTCHGTGTVPNSNRERAEFIRVQVELAELERDRGGNGRTWTAPELVKRDALRERERELLIPNWGRWRPPALSIMGDTIICRNIVAESDDVPMPGDVVIEFRRGFVESVTCTLTAFLECAAELFRSQPVTTVVLTCREPEELLTGAGWMWRRGLSEDGGASSLPSELYGRLAKPVWHMRSVALEELSRVAIAYGRQLAGLTALPSPERTDRTRADIPG